jgi:hypothetical protein
MSGEGDLLERLKEEIEREARILRRILKEDVKRVRKEWPELFWELLAMGSPLALEVLEEGEEG